MFLMSDHRSPELQVRLFASLREQLGWGEKRIPFPEGDQVTALAVWDALQLGPWPSGVRVAVNQQFVARDQRLEVDDELAFLPPFSGG
jgi:molybdopterin synthase sulfur carrier subunit